MPYSMDSPPEAISALPEAAQKQWMEVFNSAWESAPKGMSDAEKEASCHKQAWGALKNAGWHKMGGDKWMKGGMGKGMIKAGETFYTLVGVHDSEGVAFDDEGKAEKHLLLPYGTFQHPVAGQVVVDEERVKRIKHNFDTKAKGTDCLIDLNHEGAKASAGEITELEIGEDGLYGVPVFNSLGRELVGDKQYRYMSVEIGNQPMPDGTAVADVLRGVALTNRPFFKNQGGVTLAASVDGSDEEQAHLVRLDESTADAEGDESGVGSPQSGADNASGTGGSGMKGSERRMPNADGTKTAEEIAAEEEATKAAAAKAEADTKAADLKAEEDKKAEALKAEEAAKAAAAAGSADDGGNGKAGVITMTETELKAIDARMDRLEKANAQYEEEKALDAIGDRLDAMTFEETLSQGKVRSKLTPDMKGKAQKIARHLQKTAPELEALLFELVEKRETVQFEELGLRENVISLSGEDNKNTAFDTKFDECREAGMSAVDAAKTAAAFAGVE